MKSLFQDKGGLVLALEKNSRQEEFSKVDVRERKSSCCQRVNRSSFLDKLRLPLAYRFANSIKNYENFLLDSKVSRNPFYNPFSFFPREETATVHLAEILKISHAKYGDSTILSRVYRPNCIGGGGGIQQYRTLWIFQQAERETLVQAQLFINELTRYRVIPVASRKYTRALVIDVTIINRFNKRNTIIPEYSSAFLSFFANRD